ncbi:hypothetical protein ACFRFU_48625 [Streptomyces sp. NPDC056704]
MIVRWLTTPGERTRPDAPTSTECPDPHEARTVALPPRNNMLTRP